MDQLWPLAQAQEAARHAVEQLVESAKRSRIHKQQCQSVADAGQEVFARLVGAVHERTGDIYILCSAAARLTYVVNNCRAYVEQFGNPSPIGRLTATIFQHPRKTAERSLSDQCKALQQVADEYARLWSSAPLRVATGAPLGALGRSPLQPFAPSPAWLDDGHSRTAAGDALPPRSLANALSSPQAPPWPSIEHAMSLPDMTPRAGPRGAGGLLTNSPGALALSPQPNALRGLGGGAGGPGSESLFTLSPSAASEEAEALRGLPFGQRSVRPSDGNPVQRLCFMRGAGGESAAVQLMVVLSRQVEVYSAALDSFHSDTPLDMDAQQVTATALYEPTIDLITGHRGGTVLVYGRVGAVLAASASTLRGGVLSAAAAAATAAQLAGVPLVIRLSRAAVTALHCVPAIELEAASAAATASMPAAAAAPAAGAGAAAGTSTAPGGDDYSTSSRARFGGAAAGASASAAPSAEAIATGAIGCCTADDVLLFTGDAMGRVMAVRYSRIQPEVLATTVFTTARRAAARSANSPPSEQPAGNLEITGLLYRSGCLLVSTATDMYSVRVVMAPPPTGNGEADGAAAGDAVRSPGAAANGGANPPQGAALPQSSSVNLLSPATSAMPAPRTGGGNALPPASTSGGGAATPTSATAAAAGSAAQPAGNSSEPIIRRGPLNLSSTLVDSFPFADFDICTALVPIDWPVPSAGQAPALPSAGSASAGGDAGLVSAASAAAPYTPRGAGILRGGPTDASWHPTARAGEFPVGGPAAAVPASGNLSVGGAPAAAATAGLPPGRSPKSVSAKQGPWRMLSAHMNGQLLMWDVTAGRLQLICAIGQPGPPIVNVFTFPELGTMVELLSTGHIRVGPLPTSSLAPPINPLGNVPVWQFGRASMRAHRGRITAGAALANCIATGSRAGGVKVHSAAELRAQAARQNVAFLTPWPAAATAAAGGGGGASGAAGGSAAGGASPTASVPYTPAADPYGAVHPRVAVMRGPGNGEPPFLGGPPGGGAAAAASAMASGAGSLASTAAMHAPYPSSGGAYPPHAISRAPSGHMSSLTSQMGVPPSAYPSMPPQTGVPGQDAYCAPYPPSLPAGGGGGGIVGGGAAAQQQRVPGPSGGGSAAGEPQMAVPMATAGSAFASLSYTHSAAEGSDPHMLPRGGGVVGGGGGGQLPNGLGHGHGHGLANGHAHSHGLRSEDSTGGNLSASSSLAACGGQKQPQQQAQKQQQQAQQSRGTQDGLRPAVAAALGGQVSRGNIKVSERTPGDATPKGKVKMTPTEEAVKKLFVPGTAGGDEPNGKLPTVGPVGYNSELDRAAVDAALEKAGGSYVEPLSPAQQATPVYLPPPRQHPTAPAAAAAAAVVGASGLPPAVMSAAAVGYGASTFGDGGGLVGMPPVLMGYPHMQPAPAQRPQVVPFTSSGYNSPQLHGHRYGSPSPLQSAGGAPPSSPSLMMSYGMHMGADLGPVPPPPMYAGGAGQHVPGPQLGNGRRRPSNFSDYDMAQLPPYDSPAEPDEPQLPPPPMVQPPPQCDPTASTSLEPQLSQNCFIRPGELRNIEQIGEGAEGIVYRGRWHHIDVAVKEMHPSSASFNRLESMAQDLSCADPASASSSQDLANLIREVSALIDLGQHPNIIRFIGVCASPPRIVTEYYKMGSLYTMLKDARQGNIRTRERLGWDKRLIMLKDIAAGMAFLHSRDYIHGDLRSPNVFVTEDQHLKLGDFGFARILGKAQNCAVPARLTNPRWQAPEVYDMADPVATYEADVYSFGIIMYEMLTFKLPYDDESEDEVVKLRHTFNPSWRPIVPPDRQLPLQNRGREGHLPPLQAYKALMMDCWAENPADRPGFHKIATRLNALCHWQWALDLIKRSLHIRQPSRPRNGSVGTDGLSVDVTPACMTPTSVSSPTASTRAAPPAPSQVYNRILDEVANTLEQGQLHQQRQGQQHRDPGLERHALEGLQSDEMPLAAASSPAAPPLPLGSSPMAAPATAQPAPLLPLLPQLPPLHPAAPHGVTPAQPQPHPAHAAAMGAVDSPTRSRPTAGFASGRPGNAAEGTRPSPPRDSGGGAPDAPRRLAAGGSPLAVSEPPALETAPTLASSGSRPLQVSAASSPFAQRPIQTAAAAAVAAALVAPKVAAPSPPSSPPPFPAVAGGDGHSLASPFQGMSLSDDEEDEGHARRAPGPAPPPAMARPAAPAVAAPAAAAPAPTPAVHPWEPRAAARPQPPAPGVAAHMLPDGAASHVPPAPPPLGTASSVAAPAAARVAAPPARASVTSVAVPAPALTTVVSAAGAAAAPPVLAGVGSAAMSGATALSRMSSFQPAPPEDPLEMRTAFHMGMGFSIEDDEEEEEEEDDE